jgi:PAS domain S-box-containing protein
VPFLKTCCKPGFLSVLILVSRAVSLPVVSSGCEYDYPPFCIVNEDGSADGFAVELLRASLDAVGYDVTFRTGPWTEIKELLASGEIDALPLVGRTPEREAVYDFTFPYMSLYGAIVVQEQNETVSVMNDLRGKTVAVLAGDNAEEYIRRNEFGLNLITTSSYEDALAGVSEGIYDAVVIQRLLAFRLIDGMGLQNLKVLDTRLTDFRQDFCFAVQEGDRETLALLNEGLSRVINDGTFQSLHSEWFTLTDISADSIIVIGGDKNYPPYEYLDENGEPAGYNIDLSRAIAEEMGLHVEFRLDEWAVIRSGLETGTIDAVAGMFYSPQRDLTFDYTQSHTLVEHVAVVRSGKPPASIEELANLDLVVMQGDIMHDYALSNGLGSNLFLVPTQEDALRELAEGRHDCALVARIPALYWIEKNGWSNLITGTVPLLSPPYCYAVSNDNQALLSILSQGLSILSNSGEYDRIREQWIGAYESSGERKVFPLHLFFWIVIPLLLILGASFLWSRSLQKQVAVQTEELRRSEIILNTTQKLAKIGGWQWDAASGKTCWTQEAYRIHGRKPGEAPLSGKDSIQTIMECYDAGDRGAILSAFNKCTDSGDPYEIDSRFTSLTGEKLWVRTIGTAQRNRGVTEIVSVSIQDITGEKLSAEEMKHSNSILSELLSFAGKLALAETSGEIYSAVCSTARNLSGADGVTLAILEQDTMNYVEEDSEQPLWKNKRIPLSESISKWVFNYRKPVMITEVATDPRIPDGSFIPDSVESIALIPVAAGRVIGVLILYWFSRCTVSGHENELFTALGNMTATAIYSLNTTETLRQSFQTLSTVFNGMVDGIIVTDPFTGAITLTNKAISDMTGFQPEELLSMALTDIYDESELPSVSGIMRDAVSDGSTLLPGVPLTRKSGDVLFADVNSCMVKIDGNDHLVGIFRDITMRRSAEARISHLNRVLRAIRDINQLIVRTGETQILISDACKLLVEYGSYASAMIVLVGENNNPVAWASAGMSDRFVTIEKQLGSGALLPCQLAAGRNSGVALVEEGSKVCFDCPITGRTPNSDTMLACLIHGDVNYGYISVSVRKGFGTDPEERNLFMETAVDLAYALNSISNRKEMIKAEEARAAMQLQLLHSQRLDAVGQLAGGIAHDFNNILQVLMGHTQILLQRFSGEEDIRTEFEEIEKSIQRAATLTKQLLMFSRRQVMELATLDLNKTISGLMKMMQRLIGEHIMLRWIPFENLNAIFADSGMLEQIILNLCVNARDAMPDGGTLTIRTENRVLNTELQSENSIIDAGNYVVLSVADTGRGMTQEVRNQAFEPFFTTKPEGEGTGLGLSTVYGIVKQHEGTIIVESEPGKGSVFTVFFPSTTGAVKETGLKSRETASGGRETILIAEDDDMVRNLAVKMLEKSGYTVLEASDGEEAVALFKREKSRVDMLLLDVLMPRMSGNDAYTMICELSPDIPVLFASGYNRNAIHTNFVLHEGVTLLHKPYSLHELLSAVRKILDSNKDRQ